MPQTMKAKPMQSIIFLIAYPSPLKNQWWLLDLLITPLYLKLIGFFVAFKTADLLAAVNLGKVDANQYKNGKLDRK